MTPPTLNRILLVDDEPDMQMVARLALETVGGFSVRVCGSAEEVLDGPLDPAPDLILMDVVMPGMDGPAAFRALRERKETSSIPVIFMTAKVRPPEVDRYREMGALGVIPKPYDPMTLADTVRKIWEECP